jgi:hypothetical protein
MDSASSYTLAIMFTTTYRTSDWSPAKEWTWLHNSWHPDATLYSKRLISWFSAANCAFRNACNSAIIPSACTTYASMAARSGPVFTMWFWDIENDRFSM